MTNNKRFIPPRPRGGKKKPITQAEIAEAIKAFQKHGGLIRELPPQDVARPNLVGNRWDSMYESVTDRW